ncbi:MAG: hypothetical protein KKH12_14640 [Gammaproteobacteria bacterium]|nr:hypothetical protein [Gammaproteobacteria bacterium]MBU1482898.1 hypothetical protein [Gammaproteobacteria bacterium]
MITDYLKYSEDLLDGVISRHALTPVKHDGSGMGEWYVYFENPEFVLGISKDRGDYIGIDLGSKIRRKPRAQMRGPWSMSHLRAYIEGKKEHFKFKNIQEEVSWLEEHEMELFDTSLLNSDELNQWAVKVSRRLFGRDSK